MVRNPLLGGYRSNQTRSFAQLEYLAHSPPNLPLGHVTNDQQGGTSRVRGLCVFTSNKENHVRAATQNTGLFVWKEHEKEIARGPSPLAVSTWFQPSHVVSSG
jgi:hypothetical protein